ncbi:hypothetical protein [Sporosarcina sp. A2]|uniref:hypothetical protein n=1 Tax=Sporosarcina sp. A2 TaxID=3393449 RepID=UPI003D7923B3
MLKISRQAEKEIPNFSSHKLAHDYFKNKYGNHFVMMSTEVIDGQNVYFYGLILDRHNFEIGRKQLLRDGGIVGALDFMNSYQPVEIFEDGRIHIIH